MNDKNIIFLSLGSNLGNKLNNLQNAVFRLGQLVGKIEQISPVYRTPAWGFEGDSFLNACISLTTELSPGELLRTILGIETGMGRKRDKEQGYQSRLIDIDLLYYGDQVINQAELRIPHPQLQLRRFVLRPLSDIAPQFYHPVLAKDTRNLLQECRDEGKPEKIANRLYAGREDIFARLNLLAIEGNIGVGKTTLATKIAEKYHGKLVLERFADNPFLPKFYEDPARYSFPLEMSFLADRYQQFTDDTSQFDLFKKFMVSDYDIFKSLIFAKITLQKEEFSLYRKVFDFMYREVIKPGIYIYLYQHTQRLLENIAKRGRDYERNIQAEYLEKINRGYMDFLKGSPDMNSLILDVSNLDFVANESDFETLMAMIQDHLVREE